MYIEHPYFYEGKYYANIDGEMIEITKEVAYAMNNFYRSSKAKKVEIKNELGEVVDSLQLRLALQDDGRGDFAAPYRGNEFFKLRYLPDICKLVKQTAHMNRQPPAVHIICLVTKQIEKLCVKD